MPRKHKTDDGYGLGHWVEVQRKNIDAMEPNRRQRLEALPGWSRTFLADQWEEGFSHLKQFADREGHCRVPRNLKTSNGYGLGHWVEWQRRAIDTMEPDRRLRLDGLPGWKGGGSRSDQWEKGFSRLKEFSEREGHCRVSLRFRTDDGYGLGQWVGAQRSRKETMESDRRLRLEALPGWSWDPFSDQWEEGFSHLKQFAGREGHCRVPRKHVADDGYGLGDWVTYQRNRTVEPDRRQRLEALPGWVWQLKR